MSSYYRKPVKQKTVLKEFKILIVSIAIFWVVEILDVFIFHGSLDRYGVQPHSVIGLRGILFAPFLHGGFGHLVANTIPFITLGWLTMIQDTNDFYIVSIVSALVGVWGVFPSRIGVSWQGHLFGFIGGAIAAKLVAQENKFGE